MASAQYGYRTSPARYGYRTAPAHYGYRYGRLYYRRSRIAIGPRVAAAPAAPQVAAPFAAFDPFAPVVQTLAAGTHAAVRTLAAGTHAALAGARQLGAQVGNASFYSGGGRTASGGLVGAATCAHRSLPFGTRVLVTNLANAHQAVLTVNDRGPFVRGRIIDVSTGAAGMLGMLHAGTAPVRVQVVGRPG